MIPEEARAAIVGVWQLVEYLDRLSDGDPWHFPYGTSPAGVFHYHPDGFPSVHVSPGADAPAGAQYLGYFGRYVIREARQEAEGFSGVVEHHMTAASAPELLEDHPDRPFIVDRDGLTIGDRQTWVRRLVRPSIPK